MFERYIMKDKDTLDSVAQEFNTTVNNLKEINNIAEEDLLRQGIELVVPSNKNGYFESYEIEKGDNLYQIGLKYNINPELLATLNGLNMNDFIYPGQELIIPKNGYSYYITTEGDTLDIVAQRFKTSKENLINTNDTIYLLPDQLLVNRNR